MVARGHFKVNDRVVILDGAHQGLQGRVLKKGKKGFCRIQLDNGAVITKKNANVKKIVPIAPAAPAAPAVAAAAAGGGGRQGRPILGANVRELRYNRQRDREATLRQMQRNLDNVDRNVRARRRRLDRELQQSGH